jgi:hypothetical protein
MSLEAMSWALVDAPDVPPECVSLLIGLANHADVRGRGAWAGQVLLAGYARKTDRSVRNDLGKLAQRGLIRRGDQSLVAHIPADSRPVVYDLALERKQASGRKHSSARQGTSARQQASGATTDRFTETQAADQEEREGTGSTLPPGSEVPGGNEEPRERKPASYKPTTNQQNSPTESSNDGGAGGTDPTLFGEDVAPAQKKPRRTRKRRPGPHPRFEEWWAAYPNRVARGDAETAYAEAVTAGADPDDLLAGAIRYHDDPKVKNGYPKGPARWLHAKCWLDEPAPPPAGRPSANGHQPYRNPDDDSAYEGTF